jgi:hypothetical protein
VPDEVYDSDEIMEHPAVPGLMLSMTERVFGAYLEIADGDGEIRQESARERPFRIKWLKPIPLTPSTTMKDFTEINAKYFKGGTG